MWLIAMAPIGLTVIMVAVSLFAYMSVLGRRQSLNLTAGLRNGEIFNPLGINVVFSQNYEWFCIEIRNQKILSDNLTISGKRKNKGGDGDGKTMERKPTTIMDNLGDDEFDF